MATNWPANRGDADDMVVTHGEAGSRTLGIMILAVMYSLIRASHASLWTRGIALMCQRGGLEMVETLWGCFMEWCDEQVVFASGGGFQQGDCRIRHSLSG